MMNGREIRTPDMMFFEPATGRVAAYFFASAGENQYDVALIDDIEFPASLVGVDLGWVCYQPTTVNKE